jgi:small conductance mechanosensitive channel
MRVCFATRDYHNSSFADCPARYCANTSESGSYTVGLAVGFALKDYVSSLIAGVMAIFEQPYRPGDWVQVDDAYGEVKSVGFRAMRIVTPDDTVVTIPHAKMWDRNIYNANSGKRDLQCIANFYLNPEHNAALVRQK